MTEIYLYLGAYANCRGPIPTSTRDIIQGYRCENGHEFSHQVIGMALLVNDLKAQLMEEVKAALLKELGH